LACLTHWGQLIEGISELTLRDERRKVTEEIESTAAIDDIIQAGADRFLVICQTG